MSSAQEHTSEKQTLANQRVALVGRLSGMSRREAKKLIAERSGEVVSSEQTLPTLIVIGDEHADLAAALGNDKSAPSMWADKSALHDAEVVKESEFWERLGLVDQTQGVRQLYTPAMLADLVEAPIAAIRRWHRCGALEACRMVRRLPYFDFQEVAIARHLAALLHDGCSLHVIERKLGELNKLCPDSDRPLADPAIVVEGSRLFLRRGDDLAEPGGQLLIDFDKIEEDEQQPALRFEAAPVLEIDTSGEESIPTAEMLQQSAQQWEDEGELDKAAEVYRTLLVAGDQTPENHFSLADLLYRRGDLSAARERYYMAIELDEEYVEARASLGCVLVENDELELALAAFQGALAIHPEYADVHYHLASLLDRLGSSDEAEAHWQMFLELAPESPWATMARTRLEVVSS